MRRHLRELESLYLKLNMIKCFDKRVVVVAGQTGIGKTALSLLVGQTNECHVFSNEISLEELSLLSDKLGVLAPKTLVKGNASDLEGLLVELNGKGKILLVDGIYFYGDFEVAKLFDLLLKYDVKIIITLQLPEVYIMGMSNIKHKSVGYVLFNHLKESVDSFSFVEIVKDSSGKVDGRVHNEFEEMEVHVHATIDSRADE
jgi:hypothetical protein